MAHPAVGDDELGASPIFMGSLWLSMNNGKSERHACCCCDRQLLRSAVVAIGSECFPGLWRDVEASHVTLDDIFIAQFESASSTRRVIELAAEDILGHISIRHGDAVASPTLKNWLLFGQKFSKYGQSIQLHSHVYFPN